MNKILSVNGITKKYGSFMLKDVSFSLERGCIMGFIGRNGAGKTTTLKSIMGLLHLDGGRVEIMGKTADALTSADRQKIGFMSGGVYCFPKKKLRTITEVTRRFYSSWDEKTYENYLLRFSLDPEKKIDELSEGMKVKYSLCLSLSHDAELFILDEPTSGLDPVSRDEIVDVFRELVQDGKKSVLFSTQITSDLDKCADYITYIKDGELLASDDKDSFVERYRLIKGANSLLVPPLSKKLIGCRKNGFSFEAMIKAEDMTSPAELDVTVPDLETVMVHIERRTQVTA